MTGSGLPVALQLRVTGSFLATVILSGSSVIFGGEPWAGVLFIGDEMTAADSELPLTTLNEKITCKKKFKDIFSFEYNNDKHKVSLYNGNNHVYNTGL